SGVVLGDDLLLGDRNHLLHHVHLAADAVEVWHDQVEARRQRSGVAAEPLDGPGVALVHGLHAGKQRDDRDKSEHDGEDAETGHIHGVLPKLFCHSGAACTCPGKIRPTSSTPHCSTNLVFWSRSVVRGGERSRGQANDIFLAGGLDGGGVDAFALLALSLTKRGLPWQRNSGRW